MWEEQARVAWLEAQAAEAAEAVEPRPPCATLHAQLKGVPKLQRPQPRLLEVLRM